MNKVAHYNGFVGRCQQYGLTKAAADMLYKAADEAAKEEGKGLWDTIKGWGSAAKGQWDGLSRETKNTVIGGGLGLLTGGAYGALNAARGNALRDALIYSLLGGSAGAGLGYAGTKAYNSQYIQNLIAKLKKKEDAKAKAKA